MNQQLEEMRAAILRKYERGAKLTVIEQKILTRHLARTLGYLRQNDSKTQSSKS